MLVAVTISLTAVVLQNTELFQVKFLWLSGEIPAILLLFMTAVAGFLMGAIVSYLMQGSSKNKDNNNAGKKSGEQNTEENIG